MNRYVTGYELARPKAQNAGPCFGQYGKKLFLKELQYRKTCLDTEGESSLNSVF